MKKHDEAVKKIKCADCNSTFSTKYNLDAHRKKKHNKGKQTKMEWIVVNNTNRYKRKYFAVDGK